MGTSNFREFSAKDLEKLGHEDQKKLRFEKGTPQEVDDEVGQTLVDNYDFSEVDDEEDAQKATKKAAKKAASRGNSGGSSSQSDGAPSTPPTGNGSSTANSPT